MRALAIAALLAGCLPRPTYECELSDECTSSSGEGVCIDGFCAFTDSSCPSMQRYGEHSGGLANECVPESSLACFGSGAYRFCLDTMPVDTLDLADTIDTSTDPRCLASQPADWIAAGQPQSCFIVGAQITVSTRVTVTGSRPLVLGATTITVNALLDGGSHPDAPGPGANSSDCLPFPTEASDAPPSGGGGAGGSFVIAGGNGGRADNNDGLAGGTPAGPSPAPTTLRGGCAGQLGGNGGGTGGVPGAGGGAILLAATALAISNSGVINVSGAGAPAPTQGSGGGGGGSGGMLVLSADSISALGAKLVANGGGGASGSNNGGTTGEAGDDPNPANPTSSANGGDTTGGDGGDGFAGEDPAGGNGGSGNNQAGGGGGGGGGYIQVTAATGAEVSPAETVVP